MSGMKIEKANIHKGVILDVCDDLLNKLLPELPDKASDFRDSVDEKVRSIRDHVEREGFATEGQWQALKNMKAGAEKWLGN